jgi:hypothetical protein
MLWKQQGYGAWSTYNSGAYLRFLGQDGTVTGGTGSPAPVVPVKVHGGWQVGTTVYATQRAADNAARRANAKNSSAAMQAYHAQLTAGQHTARATNKLGGMFGDYHLDRHGNLHGATQTAAAIAAQLGVISKDAHDAGASRAFITRLNSEAKAIVAAAKARNQAAAMLQRAAARLAQARATEHADFQTFRQARMAGFSISTAGVDPVTGKVTKGSILAQQAQDIARLKEWNHDLKHLAPLLPPAYFRELEGQTPDQALPQLRALMGMNPGQLRTLRRQAGEISQLSSAGATFGSRRLDQHAINVARRQERQAARLEGRRERHLEHLFHRMELTLTHLTVGGTAKLELKKGDLVFALQADQHHVATHRRGRKP